jgi:hypothetical protein
MAPRNQIRKQLNGLARLVWLALLWMVVPGLQAMELKEALGHFESGATTPGRCSADAKIGSHKEVSRFQILPSVWKKYSVSADYQQPAVAWTVAERILAERQVWFRQATGRECDAIDLYIMWNAPGAYQKVKWDRSRLSKVVLDRAERFANLLAVEGSMLVRANIP